MKIPTQPGRMRKTAPRKGGRRKQRATKRVMIYSILSCDGCVSGCRPGKECMPILGYVHAKCLHAYTLERPSIVSTGQKIDPFPLAKRCLHCNEPLTTESKVR